MDNQCRPSPSSQGFGPKHQRAEGRVWGTFVKGQAWFGAHRGLLALAWCLASVLGVSGSVGATKDLASAWCAPCLYLWLPPPGGRPL